MAANQSTGCFGERGMTSRSLSAALANRVRVEGWGRASGLRFCSRGFFIFLFFLVASSSIVVYHKAYALSMR